MTQNNEHVNQLPVTRRLTRKLPAILAAFVISFASGLPVLAEMTPAKSEAGLYTEEWMMAPGEDLASIFGGGLDDGKYVAVMWSAPKCKTARKVHQTVLSDERVAKKLPELFNVYQMNLKGKRLRSLPAFGRISEKDLAKILAVKRSPTLILFGAENAEEMDMPREILRLEGLFPINKLTAALNEIE